MPDVFIGHEANLRLCLQGIGGYIMGGHPHPSPPPLRVLTHLAREGANRRDYWQRLVLPRCWCRRIFRDTTPGIFVGHKWPTCVYAPMTGFVGGGASPTLHAARCWLSAYLSGHHPGVFVGHAVGYTYRVLAVTSWAATPPQPSPATGADAPCEGGGEPAGLLATTGFAALLVSVMNGRPAFIPS